MNVLKEFFEFFYWMVVIGSLDMEGDGGGCWGRWEGVGPGHWRVRVGPGSLIYRQIKSLHCSGYLLVEIYNNNNKRRFYIAHQQQVGTCTGQLRLLKK